MGNTYIFDDSHDYTGAVATFTDTHGTSRITNISVPFSPIQDLHGYDSPWPAGGGKNKLQLLSTESTTSNGVTFTVNADGTVSTQGTATGTAVFRHYMTASDLPSGENLILNGTPSGGNWRSKYGIAFCDRTGTVIGTADSGSGSTITPQGLENLSQIQIVVRSGINTTGLVFKPMVRLASVTDATFAPYSNICPISGRTGLSVWNDPKYGGTIEWNQQLYFDSFSWTINGMQCSVNNGRFTLAGTATLTGSSALVPPFIYNKTKPIQGHVYALIVSGDTNLNGLRFTVYGTPNQTISLNTIQSVIFTCNSANSTDAEFAAQYNVGEEYSADITSYLCDLTLAFGAGNEPTTVDAFKALFYKDYYPYNAGTTTCVSAVNGDPYWKKDIDWTSETGTVYGGTLDVVTGVLTVDKAMVDMGAQDWNYRSNSGSEAFYCSLSGCDFGTDNVSICSAYSFRKYITGLSQLSGVDDGEYAFFKNGAVLYMRNRQYSDTDSFKASLAEQTFVYPLATPLTYQLTPQEVSVIKNSLNNVWASTGSSITVTVKDIAYGFQGWLVKVGSSLTLVPTEMIEAESYKVTPDQRMEESAERDTTGYLWRDTVRNTPPKIEFNTPPVNNTQVAALNAIFQSAFTVKSQRKLQVAFFDPEEDCYKIWDCYMPDVEYPMHLIDPDAKTILYDSIRYAFIGY